MSGRQRENQWKESLWEVKVKFFGLKDKGNFKEHYGWPTANTSPQIHHRMVPPSRWTYWLVMNVTKFGKIILFSLQVKSKLRDVLNIHQDNDAAKTTQKWFKDGIVNVVEWKNLLDLKKALYTWSPGNLQFYNEEQSETLCPDVKTSLSCIPSDPSDTPYCHNVQCTVINNNKMATQTIQINLIHGIKDEL